MRRPPKTGCSPSSKRANQNPNKNLRATMATVGEGVERSRAEHIHLLQHLGAQERVQVLPPRTWALGGGVVVLHRSKEEKQPRSWIRERKGFVRKPRKGGFVDERTRSRSLSGRTGIYTVWPQDLGCTPAAGQPTESGCAAGFQQIQVEHGRCLPSHFTHANITGHARYWDSFCRISIFSQLGPLASFILFAGPISGPAPAFISPVVLVLRG